MNNDDTPTPEMGKLPDNYEVASDEQRQIDRNLTRLLAPRKYIKTLEAELDAAQADVERWKENAMAAKRQRDCIIDEGVEKQGRIDELENQLAAAQAELAKVTHERDDLRFVLERQDPWNKKAQAYLDAARWAGACYIQAVMTELEERDAQLASAQAEIAALRAAQEWRPIEEAPMDGTRFLAVTANGFYDVVYYSKKTQDFVGKWSPFVAWMPLPPPPKGGES